MRPADQLIAKLREHADRTVLVVADEPYRAEEIADAVEKLAARLDEEGVGAGDVVTLHGEFGRETVALLLALAARGAIVAPVGTEVPAEVEQRLEVLEPAWTVSCWSGTAEFTRHAASGPPSGLLGQIRDRGHAGLVLFSSGSTGEPKAMVHDLDTLIASYVGRKPKSLVFLALLLFDHIGGLNTLLNTLAMGATLVVPAGRDPESVAAAVARHGVQVLPGSPTFLNLLLMSGAAERHDLSGVRLITYGTEPMPEALLARIKEGFPRARLLQTFGTSETGIARTASKSSTSTLLRIEAGDHEYRIVDGELWLRSSTQVLGYLNAPMDAFTDDGWFKTGDLVEEADDGYLRIVGRLNEVINVGGEKVTPTEVETVILELPEVSDCTVFGKANPITGQMVAARVVVAGDQPDKEVRKLVRRHCAARLDEYKVPQKVEVLGRLAHTDRYKKVRS